MKSEEKKLLVARQAHVVEVSKGRLDNAALEPVRGNLRRRGTESVDGVRVESAGTRSEAHDAGWRLCRA